MIVVYLGCLLLLLYYLYTRSYSYWESRGVPFEKPFLIFGNFYNVAAKKQHIFHVFRDIYAKFKTPYVGIYILNQPSLLIRSPELIKKMLVKDFDKFMNRQFASNESADPLSVHSMFSAKDQIWRNVRSKISPVFTSGKMKLMLPLIKECTSNLTAHLEKRTGEVVEVRSITKKYAVDIISSCAFGVNAHCLKDDSSEILKVANKISDFKSFYRSLVTFSYFFVPILVDIFKFKILDKSATDYLTNMFNDTISERKKKNISRNDLIDLLNGLQEQETIMDGYKFDNIKLVSQALTFFSAGNETTSLTIAYALYELAVNQQVQERLRQEVKETFEKQGEFSYEAIQEMKYLDMVLNETLRKYPLTTFLSRKSTSEYTFEETGFTLDKDVSVVIPVSGLHYDAEYFPDPEKFDPERFSDENKNKIVPYTFMPFGEGPRNCIGQRFAILVVKSALASVIKDFSLERTESTEVPLKFDPASVFLENTIGMHLKLTKV